MTKRLTIALVAVALFVLLAVMPVSAVSTTNPNGTQIDIGATVFIGEEHLNLTHALNAATTGYGGYGTTTPFMDNVPGNLTIGWWASAAQITSSAPTKTINLQGGRYYDFTVASADFVGYTGNWYLLKSDGTTAQTGAGSTPAAVMNVQDPTLSVAVWDFQQSKDITGMSITQGEHLGVQINTNMYAATYSNRNNTQYTSSFTWTTNNWPYDPNGNYASTRGANFTTSQNGTFVWKDNTKGVFGASQPASNVWLVRNYSSWINTTYGVPIGTYYQYYFNSSTPAAGDMSWTASNMTSDAQGTTPLMTAANTWTQYNTINNAYLIPNATMDGFINVYVKDESGGKYDRLYVGAVDSVWYTNHNMSSTLITKQFPTTQPFLFGSATNYWVTDYVDSNGQYAYPVGTYSVWAESALNNMKETTRMQALTTPARPSRQPARLP